MKRFYFFSIFFLAFTACSSESDVSAEQLDPASPAVSETMDSGAEMAGGEMTENKMAMDHDMEVTSEASFVVNMIPHHREAVETSTALNEVTDNVKLKDLTERIVAAQAEEITMMQGWVVERYADAEPAAYENMMPNVDSLDSEERDDAWLNGMIVHHQMAVKMSEDVIELEPSEDVTLFARSIIETQEAEISEMQELLKE